MPDRTRPGHGGAPMKIAYIGGGSRHWAPVVMQDLALTPGIEGEIRLYDIDLERARGNARFGNAIFAHPDALSRMRVSACEDLASCLAGSDFVFISILPGPVTAFANDLDIPLRFGWVQTVGDTLGPGGLSRSLRSVPMFAEIARAVAEHCPNAWVINYTNPMTVATQALVAEAPSLKVLGCCHEVFGTRAWIGGMAAEQTGIPMRHRNDVEVEVVGVNHFTFFTRATYHGEDVFPMIRAWIERQGEYFRDRTSDALAREAKGRFGSCDGLIQLDFLRRFGVVGAAGDRHLVEFVPWYAQSVESLRRWGVSVTGSAQRLKNWHPDNVAAVPEAPERLRRSGEEAVDLVRALAGGGRLVTNVNVPNRGQVPWLPPEHVVETLAVVDRDSIEPVPDAGGLPEGLQTHVRRAADIQRTTLRAAREVDRDLALAALLADPLCRLDTDHAALLLDALIEANRAWLPAGW
jgi:alpha-galactosidase/6-phospho-beta-glucosidase family protein